MIRSLISRLNEPFPDRQSGVQHIRDTFLIGLFIGSFLYLFNPFNFQTLPMGRAWASISFGLISIACSLSFDFVLRIVCKVQTDLPTWTLWRWLLSTLLLVSWIALGNFSFLAILYPPMQQFQAFLYMLRDTFMVAIIPVVVSGLLIQLRAVQRFQTEASEVGQRLGEPTNLESAQVRKSVVEFKVTAGESLCISASDIILIEAMQNYLTVFHASNTPNSDLQKTVLRTTMNSAESSLRHTSVMRCHRSYMVNLRAVSNVSGNAQGLKLSLDRLADRTVPVSRRFIAEFKKAMQGIKHP